MDVTNGTYNVTVQVGDTQYAHDQMGISLEGAQVDSVTTSQLTPGTAEVLFVVDGDADVTVGSQVRKGGHGVVINE